MASNMYSKDPRARKARSALAKANTITVNVEGIYEADRLKFNSMAQDLGITFDGNNNVLDNTTKDRLDALEEINYDTNEPTGFNRELPNTMGVISISPDGTKTINKDGYENITINSNGLYADGTTASAREIRIAPYNGNDIWIYIEGTKYVLDSAQSLILPNVSGLYFIYFDIVAGVPTLSYDLTFSFDYFEDKPIVCTAYGNAITQDLVNFGDERHGITMDGFTHRYLHFTRGTEYGNGMNIDFTPDTSTIDYISIGSGTAYDEDIFMQPKLQTNAPFLYLLGTGANKFWRIADNTTKFGYFNGTAFAHYNKYDSATDTWSIDTMNQASKDFSYCIIALTNNIEYPYVKFMGQEGYSNTGQIKDAINTEINSLVTEGLPSPEFLPIYAFIIDKSGRLEKNDYGTFVLDLRKPPLVY